MLPELLQGTAVMSAVHEAADSRWEVQALLLSVHHLGQPPSRPTYNDQTQGLGLNC